MASKSSLLFLAFSASGRSNSSGPVAEWLAETNSLGEGAVHLGHRRWLLWPWLRTVTYASSDVRHGQMTAHGSAMKVRAFDKSTPPAGAVVSPPDFVAHPFGVTPVALFPDKSVLSFSLTGVQWVGADGNGLVDYKQSSVAITVNGQPVRVGHLSWTGPGPGNVLAFDARIRANQDHVVTIQGVRVKGAILSPFSYTFRVQN